MRTHLAIARALSRSLKDTYEYLGDELQLWELEYALSPWGPERDDLNAWKVAACVAPSGRNPKWTFFDRTRPPRAPLQTLTEASADLERAAMTWPKAKRIKQP